MHFTAACQTQYEQNIYDNIFEPDLQIAASFLHSCHGSPWTMDPVDEELKDLLSCHRSASCPKIIVNQEFAADGFNDICYMLF